MANDCIRIGLDNNVSTMNKLCNITYKQLTSYNIMSYYKLCAISHAAGILANRKKSIKRGINPRRPYATKPLLISCYGFKIVNSTLKVPLGDRQYFDIPLNRYVRKILSNQSIRIRSFTLTVNAVSICYSKEVTKVKCTGAEGVDRNLSNITVGNDQQVKQYDLLKAVDIAENTRSIVKSFKRNDFRIRQKLYSKYGKRRKNRINQLLHCVSKTVVQSAKKNKTAIVFEDIHCIRKLYQRGNYQCHTYRGRMNSWSFAEIKHQIEYKAAW
jgi:putative transposase